VVTPNSEFEVSELKEGEKMDDSKQSVPSCSVWKEALMALSVLGSVIRHADL
jgi:hypothetical protein